jgi:uroporphyrin-3 C-methyltransferase
MVLSQTQVALLRRQQGIYDESLTNVKRLLGQYYRKDDAIAKAMLSQINDLEQVKVLAQLPDISGSLMALQGFIGAMHDRPQAQAVEN